MAITEGTANPRAHGHEATNTPIPLSTIQHIEHFSFNETMSNLMRRVHTIIVKILKRITDLTKILAIDLHTA